MSKSNVASLVRQSCEAVKCLTLLDYESLIQNYMASRYDPSISCWSIHGDEYKQHENIWSGYIKSLQDSGMAQFINLKRYGVIYEMEANKRDGYEGVLGFDVRADIHCYHITEIDESRLVFCYNGLMFMEIDTLIKYLVCQTYRIKEVKPVIDPDSFNRILYDDLLGSNSSSLDAVISFIWDHKVT